MPSSRIERNGRGQDYLGVDQIERIRREKFRSLRTPEKRSLRLLNLREKFEEHQEKMFAQAKKKALTVAFNAETGRIRETSGPVEPGRTGTS